MRELKLFVLRLLTAAFLITFCMTVSRSSDKQAQSGAPQSSATASASNLHSSTLDASNALAPAGQNTAKAIARLKLAPAVPGNR